MPTPQALKDVLRRNEYFEGAVYYNPDLSRELLIISDESGTALASYELNTVVRYIAKSNLNTIEDKPMSKAKFDFDITDTEAFKNLMSMDFSDSNFFRGTVKANEDAILYALTHVQRLSGKFSSIQWNYAYVELLAELEHVEQRIDALKTEHIKVIMESPLILNKDMQKKSEESQLDKDYFELKSYWIQQQKNILVTLWLIAFAILDSNAFCISKSGRDKKHPCYTLANTQIMTPAFNFYMRQTTGR